MPVTVSSQDNYVVVIDEDNDSVNKLSVVWGTSAAEVFDINESSRFLLTGDLEATERFDFHQRDNGRPVMTFVDSNDVQVAELDAAGRWRCGANGVQIKVASACPSDAPSAGATRALYSASGSPTTYGIFGYVGGGMAVRHSYVKEAACPSPSPAPGTTSSM